MKDVDPVLRRKHLAISTSGMKAEGAPSAERMDKRVAPAAGVKLDSGESR